MKKICAILVGFLAISFVSVFAVEGLAEIIMSQYIIEQNSLEVYFDMSDEDDEQMTVKEKDITVSVVDKEYKDVEFNIESINQSSDDGIGYLLVVDRSKSVDGFEGMKAAMSTLVEHMGIKDRVAIISFGDEVVLEQKFTANSDLLNETIDTLGSDQTWTKLYTGLTTAISYAQSAGADIPDRRVIIVYSDGVDYNDGGETKLDVIEELNAARTYPIYALQFDANRDDEKVEKLQEFSEIIEVSNGKFITVAGKGVEASYNQIYDMIGAEYYLNLEMDAPAGDYVITIESDYEGLTLTDSLDVYINRDLTMEAMDGTEEEADTEQAEGEAGQDSEGADSEETTEIDDESGAKSGEEADEDVDDDEDAGDSDDSEDDDEDEDEDKDEDEDDDENKDDESILGNISNALLFVIVGVLLLIVIILIIVFIVTGKKGKKQPEKIITQSPPEPVIPMVNSSMGKHILLKPFESTAFKGMSADVKQQVVIGSTPGLCDLVYNVDPEIKGQHFVIQLEGDRLYIFNVAPENETYVNGFPLQGKREILCDDIIAFGSIEVQIIF